MLDLAARLLDPAALALVAGGTAAAAAVRGTREDMIRALAALRPLLCARPVTEALAAERALRRIEQIVEAKGIACADHVTEAGPFVRRAALRLADAANPEDFAAWAQRELDEKAARHEGAAAVWRAAAEAAPAMGMIGTILGLIGMFASMDDPATIGPAMALALLTTFYGLVLSAGIAGPIAGRLERLSLAERRWQEQALARLEALARAETQRGPGSWRRARAA